MEPSWLASFARRRALHHRRRPADGGPPHVLRRFQGAARAWLFFKALSRRPCRRDRLVSRPRAISNDRRRRLPASARHLGLSSVRQGMVLAVPRARRFSRPTSGVGERRSRPLGRALSRSFRLATRPTLSLAASARSFVRIIPGQLSVWWSTTRARTARLAVASAAAGAANAARPAHNRHRKRPASGLDRQTGGDAPGPGRGRGRRVHA